MLTWHRSVWKSPTSAQLALLMSYSISFPFSIIALGWLNAAPRLRGVAAATVNTQPFLHPRSQCLFTMKELYAGMVHQHTWWVWFLGSWLPMQWGRQARMILRLSSVFFPCLTLKTVGLFLVLTSVHPQAKKEDRCPWELGFTKLLGIQQTAGVVVPDLNSSCPEHAFF